MKVVCLALVLFSFGGAETEAAKKDRGRARRCCWARPRARSLVRRCRRTRPWARSRAQRKMPRPKGVLKPIEFPSPTAGSKNMRSVNIEHTPSEFEALADEKARRKSNALKVARQYMIYLFSHS